MKVRVNQQMQLTISKYGNNNTAIMMILTKQTRIIIIKAHKKRGTQSPWERKRILAKQVSIGKLNTFQRAGSYEITFDL